MHELSLNKRIDDLEKAVNKKFSDQNDSLDVSFSGVRDEFNVLNDDIDQVEEDCLTEIVSLSSKVNMLLGTTVVSIILSVISFVLFLVK